MSLATLSDRLNTFLYRQQVRKLGPAEIEMARDWCMQLIKREHPNLTEEQRELFYENLIKVQVNAIDEWSRRMS